MEEELYNKIEKKEKEIKNILDKKGIKVSSFTLFRLALEISKNKEFVWSNGWNTGANVNMNKLWKKYN